MRLWLKDADRKPDPHVARSGGRKAVLVGTAVWLLAAVTAALCWPLLAASGNEWMLWCALVGLVIGVIGFVVVRLRRTNEERDR